MKLIVNLYLMLVSSFAIANVEIKFNNNSVNETYRISRKNVELIDKNGKKTKSLSVAESKILESHLLEVFWSSKQNNESLKNKCIPYAEIFSGAESRFVCAQDRKNKNKTFTILNSLNRYFK